MGEVPTDSDGRPITDADGPERWVDREDYTDTGAPVDGDYVDTHEEDTTVSVGFDAEAFEVGDPLIADGSGEGSGSESDAWIDENEQRHTVAGSATSVVGTTFYADDMAPPSRPKWNWLFLLHAGKDKHRRVLETEPDSNNPRHKENTNTRLKRERTEALCDGLTRPQTQYVCSVVERTNFSRFTYLGSFEVVVVGIIAAVVGEDHPAVAEAADVVREDLEYDVDISYVKGEVEEKIDSL